MNEVDGMFDVLFVEDDEAICFLVSHYPVWAEGTYRLAGVAHNGREALERLEKEPFDLVITDIRMPVMDGLALTRQIRDGGYSTAVVLASTYSDFEYAKEGMRLGALDYIQKPLTSEMVAETLELVRPRLEALRALRGKAAEPAGETLLEAAQWETAQWEESHPESGARLTAEILESLLAGDAGLEALLGRAADICMEEAGAKPEEAARRMSQILAGLWEQMLARFPWLSVAPDPALKVHLPDCRRDFITLAGALEGVARDFCLARQDGVTSRICRILAGNLREPDLTGLVTEKLDLSRDYVRVLFKNKTGSSLNDYTTMLRMEYARRLLTQSNLKVYEIAEEVGYGTIDYFTRLFKNYTGDTPLKYRRRISQ